MKLSHLLPLMLLLVFLTAELKADDIDVKSQQPSPAANTDSTSNSPDKANKPQAPAAKTPIDDIPAPASDANTKHTAANTTTASTADADGVDANADSDSDSGEITVTATRIVKKTTGGGTVEVDLSQDADVTTSVGRVTQPADWSGSSFSVVTANDLSKTGTSTLAGAFNYVPGVNVSTNGQPGAATTISIRGGGSDQTSVLIDGVRVNSTIGSGGGGSFNLASMGTAGLSRITVLRGPQSALYGSQAMSGAVDMQIKKGSGKPKTKIAQEIGGGEHMLYRTRASSEGGNDKANYFIAGEWTETRGLGSSAIPTAPTLYNESDGYSQPVFVSRVGLTPTENIEISLIANYSYLRSSQDLGAFQDSPNPYSTDQEFFLRPKLWVSTFNNTWEHELGFAYIDSQQATIDDTTDTDSRYDGRSYQVDYKSTLKALDWNTLVAGVEYRNDTGHESGTSGYYWGNLLIVDPITDVEKSSLYEYDFYAQDQIRLFDEWFIVNFGGRIVNNELTGTNCVWNSDATFNIKPTGTSLKASAGTGYKAPTLYQLYAPANAWGAVGNKKLKPEESFGCDVGIGQDILAFWKKDVLVFNADYFYNYYTNLIQFDMVNNTGFQNIGKAMTYGFELSATLNITKHFQLNAGYTNLQTKNLDDENGNYGNALVRNPWNKAYINGNLNLFDEKVNLNAGVIFNGASYSDVNNFYSNDPYVDLNAAASYQFTKHFRVYGSLNNILGENCSLVRGYQSPGINGFVGIEASF